MTNLPGSRLLYTALSKLPGDMTTRVFRPMSDQLTRLLVGYGDRIPRSAEAAVLTEAGKIVMSYFVGSDGRSPFGRDGVSALAPYPRLLNQYLVKVQGAVVLAHQRYLRTHLPDDVYTWLQGAKAARQQDIQELRIPVSEARKRNPATYQAAHTWVDKRGYRLSDRIWATGETTRRRIDALLSEGIRTGRSSSAMAKDLEAFLLPTRTLKRTNKPYGRDASFDAMRLARTEISRAHAQATFAAARANPFTDGMDWKLSARHPKVDICDTLATIGMDGSRIRQPYPLDTAPVPIEDSHPQCLCVVMPYVTATPAQVVASLREQMIARMSPPLTPAVPYEFAVDLLGATLVSYVFFGFWNQATKKPVSLELEEGEFTVE